MNNDKMIILVLFQFIVMTSLLLLEINGHLLGLWKTILYTALFVVTAFLLFMHFRCRTKLKLTVTELRRVINGNLKTRLFVKNDDHLFNEMIFSINELIDKLEKVQVETVKSQTARRRLLSNISHDIRTPVTSIIGYVDALRDGIATSQEEKQEYLTIISKKSNSLKQLIDEIFHMAKLEADEVRFNTELLDFAEVVRESLIEFLHELKKYGMELKVQIPEKNCWIMADRLSLVRIISNIIHNAIRYGKEGKVLGVMLTETPREYQLLIWDQGPGISKEHLGNVFERMYRSDQSRNPKNGGSGLGLAITRALVEKNRGRIWAESIPWEKTTFGFSIPKYEHSD